MKKRLVILRRTSQVACFAIFISSFLAALNYTRSLVPPGVLFRFDPLVTVATSIAGKFIAPGIFISVLMIALTLVFGRFFCGWMCPLGAVLDAAAFVIRKKSERAVSFGVFGRSFKFIVMSVLVLIALAGNSNMLIADPLVIMSNLVTLNLAIPNLALFAIALASVILIRRFWCRFLCPLGALYAIPASVARLRRVVTKECSDSCRACHKKCRMGAIKEDASYVKSECILCMDCVYDCPEHATRFRFK